MPDGGDVDDRPEGRMRLRFSGHLTLSLGMLVTILGGLWRAFSFYAEHQELKKDVAALQAEMQLRAQDRLELEHRLSRVEERAGLPRAGLAGEDGP